MRKIYVNGDFITLENTDVDAIEIENDKILKVGSKNEILNKFNIYKKTDKNVEIIDLKGKTMMPSFIDAHSHIFGLAKQFLGVSIDDAKSITDIKNKLNEYKKYNKTDDWIIINGYDINELKEKRHITKQEIDEIFPDIPVIIENKSRHNGIANSKALEKLEINENTKNPEGGKIIYKTGYLEESAFINSLKKVPLPKIENIQKAFNKAQETYASYGITTAQEGCMTIELAKVYKSLVDNNDLFLDIVAYMEEKSVNEIEELFKENLLKYNKNFKIGGIKIFLDGSPQAKTAWLRTPYECEKEYSGYRILSDDKLESILLQAKSKELQVLAHCNGDKAIEQYINSIKKINNLKRPVMIHAQILGLDQLEGIKKYNIIPSFFIGHVYYFGDIHIKNLGEERAEHISPAGSSLKENILFTFHQDTPVTIPNMFETIWCAVNRKTKEGVVLGKSEQIPVLDAIKAVTINSAYQYREENLKGSINEGKKADLIILDKNPLKIDKDDIKNIMILETIKNGKTIYKA